jgi:hypothetical protein
MIRASAAVVNALVAEPIGTSVYTDMCIYSQQDHRKSWKCMYAYLWGHFVAIFCGYTPSIILELVFSVKANKHDRVPRNRIILEYLDNLIV